MLHHCVNICFKEAGRWSKILICSRWRYPAPNYSFVPLLNGQAFAFAPVRRFGVSRFTANRQFLRRGQNNQMPENMPKSSKIKGSEVKRLFALAKPERKRLWAAVALLTISSAVSLSVPFLLGRFIDKVVSPDKQELAPVPSSTASASDDIVTRLKPFCGIMAVVFLVGALANFGRIYLMNSAGERIVNRLRTTVFANILKQEVAFFDATKTGELVNRLSNDTSVIGYTVTMNISDGLRSIASSVGSVGMMFYVSPTLAFVGLSIVPSISVAAMLYGRYLKKLTEKLNDALADATQIAEERLSNLRTIRAFATENREKQAYERKIDGVLQLAFKNAKANALFYGFTGLSGNLSVLSVLYVGGCLIAENQITVGQLSSFLVYVLYVGISVAGMGSFYTELMRGLGASTRLFQLAERKPTIDLSGGMILPSLSGQIEFRDVSFTYPDRAESQILSHLNLLLPAGSVTALVGASGAGKSTIGSLLLRFYDPVNGAILVDGQDLKHLDNLWLKQHIGVVNQEPVLFSGTLRENIAYAAKHSESVSDEQIWEAAKQANAYNFIKTFPDELDTVVGEKGASLSGGQKQRIAIARALLKDPKILLLDEATSALDSESEYLVKKALDNLIHSGKRTVITIAHRLSTVKHADQIAVVDAGKIAEKGTYAELMTIENGLFRRLVERQTIKDSLADGKPAADAEEQLLIIDSATGDEVSTNSEESDCAISLEDEHCVREDSDDIAKELINDASSDGTGLDSSSSNSAKSDAVARKRKLSPQPRGKLRNSPSNKGNGDNEKSHNGRVKA